MAEKKKGWIKKAINPAHRGEFAAKAKAAGESTAEFAKEHKADAGTLGKQAKLASTLMDLGHKRRKSPLYDHKRS